MPNSLGRSFRMTASAPIGRSAPIKSASVIATSLPAASYHGPLPTRSLACTGPPLGPPLVVLRNARHCLVPAPGMPSSAIALQILSAPRSPAPSPTSPKRRSPPKPSGLPDTALIEARLVTKKLNLSSKGLVVPVLPAAAPGWPAELAPPLAAALSEPPFAELEPPFAELEPPFAELEPPFAVPASPEVAPPVGRSLPPVPLGFCGAPSVEPQASDMHRAPTAIGKIEKSIRRVSASTIRPLY